jgi:hypothetical protein
MIDRSVFMGPRFHADDGSERINRMRHNSRGRPPTLQRTVVGTALGAALCTILSLANVAPAQAQAK